VPSNPPYTWFKIGSPCSTSGQSRPLLTRPRPISRPSGRSARRRSTPWLRGRSISSPIQTPARQAVTRQAGQATRRRSGRNPSRRGEPAHQMATYVATGPSITTNLFEPEPRGWTSWHHDDRTPRVYRDHVQSHRPSCSSCGRDRGVLMIRLLLGAPNNTLVQPDGLQPAVTITGHDDLPVLVPIWPAGESTTPSAADYRPPATWPFHPVETSGFPTGCCSPRPGLLTRRCSGNRRQRAGSSFLPLANSNFSPEAAGSAAVGSTDSISPSVVAASRVDHF